MKLYMLDLMSLIKQQEASIILYVNIQGYICKLTNIGFGSVDISIMIISLYSNSWSFVSVRGNRSIRNYQTKLW